VRLQVHFQTAVLAERGAESDAEVGKLLEHVRVGSDEQAKGIASIAQEIAQMGEVAARAVGNAIESSAASDGLSTQAAAMKNVVNRLLEIVDGAGKHGL